MIQNINIDIKNIDLNVNIGTEDAGITAILVGILAGILGIIIKSRNIRFCQFMQIEIY